MSNLACFDVNGVTVGCNWHPRGWFPLMDRLLEILTQEDWETVFISTRSEDYARAKVGKMAPPDAKFVSSHEKHVVLKHLLGPEVERAVFVDNQAKNLVPVAGLDDSRLEVFGFIGTGSHSHEIVNTCQQHGARLVFTALDLATILGLKLGEVPDDFSLMELSFLVRGLPHTPGSDPELHGDHQVIRRILQHQELDENVIDELWGSIAWMGCGECAWRTMVRMACKQADLTLELLGLTSQGQAEEYTATLCEAPVEARARLEPIFLGGWEDLKRGVLRLGNDAGQARPAGHEIATDRLAFPEQQLRSIFGEDFV